MKKQLLLAGTVLLSLMTACQDDGSDAPSVQGNTPKEYVPIQLTEAETRMASQNTDFAFRLFKAADEKLTEEQGEEAKVFLSPLSASYALSMVANGADGTTLEELAGALGFSGSSLDEINAYNRKLLTRLVEQDNTTNLATANSLWMFDDFRTLDSYRETLSAEYDAEVRIQDRSGAKDAINAWCAEKTKGCITDFLKNEPKGETMLLNALYFKGIWAEGCGFNERETKRELFANEDGSSVYVDMMNATHTYAFAQNDTYAVVRMPYGNGAFGLHVLLPQEGVTLDGCIASLDGTGWNDMLADMTPEMVELKLPKFTVDDCQNDLISTLKAMGIKEAFLPTADFSKMAGEPLMISDVTQSLYFSLDEEGTEAAAVTGIGMDVAAPEPGYNEVREFYVNRPFLFLLTEKSTGTVLFMGKVNKL